MSAFETVLAAPTAQERLVAFAELGYPVFKESLIKLGDELQGDFLGQQANNYASTLMCIRYATSGVCFYFPESDDRDELMRMGYEQAASAESPNHAGLIAAGAIDVVHALAESNGRSRRAIRCIINGYDVNDETLMRHTASHPRQGYGSSDLANVGDWFLKNASGRGYVETEIRAQKGMESTRPGDVPNLSSINNRRKLFANSLPLRRYVTNALNGLDEYGRSSVDVFGLSFLLDAVEQRAEYETPEELVRIYRKLRARTIIMAISLKKVTTEASSGLAILPTDVQERIEYWLEELPIKR